jgi:hypothetical protein
VLTASASRPRDHGFEPYAGLDHVFFSYDTMTGLFHKKNSKVIKIR